MQPSDDLVDGTVYLIVDPYPEEGPAQHVSGEEALAGDFDDWAFRPRLVIGVYAGEIQYVDHSYMVSLESHISQARLSSVAAAVQSNAHHSEVWPDRIYIHNGEGPINHGLLDLDERTYLEINSSRIGARVEERYGERPKMPRAEYREMVESVAQNYGCHVLDVGYFDVDGTAIGDEYPAGFIIDEDEDVDYYADMVHVVEITLVADDEESLAGRLIDCGRAVHDYLAAIRGGELDAQKIMSVLRGGHTDVLVGMQESGHLEIKSSQYNINAPGQIAERQKIELAQDVARFANGDTDAILVLGYAEEKSTGDSRVGKLAPLNLTNIDIGQYQAVLDSKIVPSITGLTIEKVQVDSDSNAGVVFIFVPRQPEEMQPYLVQGAVVGDKLEGAFFSIVQRRGEASITVNASQIHGYIVAGKAFLRRGK